VPIHDTSRSTAEGAYQVIHFWTTEGDFAGWYINFEAPRRRFGNRIDSVDWHLDLWIGPDLTPSWKDEDEAAAAVGTEHLRAEDLQAARHTGEGILADLPAWPSPIGDWRCFRPDPAWTTPQLPPGCG
jgi:predicted RNA-binding protein associated with RNAse of E/G family